jgi:hypothetical protein
MCYRYRDYRYEEDLRLHEEERRRMREAEARKEETREKGSDKPLKEKVKETVGVR